MSFGIEAELDEIARRRTEAFAAKQQRQREERAERLARRKYGKAKQHALKLARTHDQGR